MDQLILFHKPNKIVDSEMMIDHFIPQSIQPHKCNTGFPIAQPSCPKVGPWVLVLIFFLCDYEGNNISLAVRIPLFGKELEKFSSAASLWTKMLTTPKLQIFLKAVWIRCIQIFVIQGLFQFRNDSSLPKKINKLIYDIPVNNT
jgi:hypothetical protein